jgi:hypothetical protein
VQTDDVCVQPGLDPQPAETNRLHSEAGWRYAGSFEVIFSSGPSTSHPGLSRFGGKSTSETELATEERFYDIPTGPSAMWGPDG